MRAWAYYKMVRRKLQLKASLNLLKVLDVSLEMSRDPKNYLYPSRAEHHIAQYL